MKQRSARKYTGRVYVGPGRFSVRLTTYAPRVLISSWSQWAFKDAQALARSLVKMHINSCY